LSFGPYNKYKKTNSNADLSMEIENSNVPISLVSSNTLDGKIKKEAIVIDPVGAIIISAAIIIVWCVYAHSTYSMV